MIQPNAGITSRLPIRIKLIAKGFSVHITPKGGGGTAFAKTFEWVEDNADDAAAVIYFTDLEVRDFGGEPHCPVLWTVWGDERKFEALASRPPFGDPIYLTAY